MGKRRRSAGPKISPGGMTDVEKLVRRYAELWEGRYDERFVDAVPRTTAERAKEVIGALGLRVVAGRLDRYFQEDTRWLRDRRHPLGVFLKQVNRYGEEKKARRSGRLASRDD